MLKDLRQYVIHSRQIDVNVVLFLLVQMWQKRVCDMLKLLISDKGSPVL